MMEKIQRFGKKRFGDANPLIPKNVAQLIFSYFPPEERKEFAKVSTTWRDDVYDDPFWKRAGAASYEDFVQRFSQIRNFFNYFYYGYTTNYDIKTLRRRVLSGEYTLDLAEHIFYIWQRQSLGDRLILLPDELLNIFLDYTFPQNNKNALLTNKGIMDILDGTIDPQEAKDINYEILIFFMDNPLPKEALKRNLITLTEANQYPLNHLKRIFSREECLDAIEAGWFNIEEAAGVSLAVLQLLIPHDAWNGGYQDSEFWHALERGVITLNQANGMKIDKLEIMLCERGIWLLETGIITRIQVDDVSVENLKYLVSAESVDAILDNKITVENLIYFPVEILKILATESGTRILENHIIHRSVACEIGVENLRALVSEAGEAALIEKRFSVEDVLNLSPSTLRFIIGEWGPVMLDPKNPLVTTQELKKLTSMHLQSLFTENGFTALSEGLVNIDQIYPPFEPAKLAALLSDDGIEMLRKDYVTFEDMASVNSIGTLKALINNEDFKGLLCRGFVKFSNFANLYYDPYFTGGVISNQIQNIQAAIHNLENYKDRLIGLNTKLPSLNKNSLRHEKGEQLQSLFFNGQTSTYDDSSNALSSICDTHQSVSETENNDSGNDLIESILSDPENNLIKNCSRLPFKFFKITSRTHGYRNPFLENRLCESKVEVNLVKLHAARAG